MANWTNLPVELVEQITSNLDDDDQSIGRLARVDRLGADGTARVRNSSERNLREKLRNLERERIQLLKNQTTLRNMPANEGMGPLIAINTQINDNRRRQEDLNNNLRIARQRRIENEQRAEAITRPRSSSPSGMRDRSSSPSGMRPRSSSLSPMRRPSIPSGMRPRIPSGIRPSIPSGMRPRIPSGMRPRIPSGMRPRIPSGMRPRIPSGMRPRIPSGMRPSIPSGMRPSIPSGMRPSIPSGMRPSIPSGMRPRSSSTVRKQLWRR
jgi:hypothetical protein